MNMHTILIYIKDFIKSYKLGQHHPAHSRHKFSPLFIWWMYKVTKFDDQAY